MNQGETMMKNQSCLKNETAEDVIKDINNKASSMVKPGLGYVESHEEAEALKLIENQLGFEPPRVAGWRLIVWIYTRPEELSTITDEKGNKVSIIAPMATRTNDKYRSVTGLVVAVGPEAYKGDRYESSGPWCRV